MSLGIGDIIKPVQDALTPVGNTLSDAWQIVLGDRIAAWRLTNAAKIQVKVNEQVQALGLKLNTAKIPERYALAWFEEATKQDEDEIQTLFAKLLAKAAAGDEDALDRRHISVLAQFTPIDAKAFSILGDANFSPTDDAALVTRSLLGIRWDAVKLERALVAEHGEQYAASLEHLTNIGILDKEYEVMPGRPRPSRSLSGSSNPTISYETQRRYRLTRLGASLSIAVK
ncbi:Abi-alpha family protein [Sphingobium sp. DN12]|uniref:Abi-alpha family protein n=1 Tax=Sphingobium sp. DN12 TaxID=3378073 RepID=UPI003DA452DB